MQYKNQDDKYRKNVIYKITDKTNNMIYVGQTTMMLKRTYCIP